MARISCAPIESVTFLRTSFGPNRLVTPSTARMGGPSGMRVAKAPSVRATGGELVDVLLVDSVHRHHLILLHRFAVEMTGDLLGRSLGFFRGNLGGGTVLLAGPDVQDAVLHAVAGDHDDALVGDAGLHPGRLDGLDHAGRLVVRH